MNTSNNDSDTTILGKPVYNDVSDGNQSANRMMFDKSNEGSIDDLNFNESLDAFLYSENLTDVTTPMQHELTVSDGMNNLRNYSMDTTSVPGMMTGEEAVNPTSTTTATARAPDNTASSTVYPTLASIPYNIALPGQSAAQGSYNQRNAASFSPTPLAPQSVALAPQQQYSSAVAFSNPPATTAAPDQNHQQEQQQQHNGQPSNKRKAAKSSTTARPKRMRGDATAVSEDDDERHKRRQGRNVREQQRSQRITQQIDHLREVLSGANIAFKPDKYSTLVTVADYIKQLQAKSAALDAEHGKLLSTISKTNKIVNNQYLPASTTGENPPGDMIDGASLGDANGHANESPSSSEGVLVPNIDYRSVFASCGVPLAVASIDGRFLDCNAEFLKVIGYSKGELLPCHHLTSVPDEVPSELSTEQDTDANKNLSLFNLLHRDHMEAVFLAMSEMLKRPAKTTIAITTKPLPGQDCWAGYVYLTRLPETKMRMNVSLVRGSQGGAKFFDCSLLPVPSSG
ncbi:unnamed protein product [Cylindrotheca closterium]|uniref:BHLH domain-containing protein n=1 Tax=Cylindrotheca closterium TaxID=2856 RepID=A0AAD2G058_9STRA|nr:unnamed protein product [Cylindrotheca closterium]